MTATQLGRNGQHEVQMCLSAAAERQAFQRGRERRIDMRGQAWLLIRCPSFDAHLRPRKIEQS